MNYFFKFLIPQLLKYFENDKTLVKDFLPSILINNFESQLLIETKERNYLDNERTNKN